MPTRFIYLGDRDRAQGYVGIAQSFLAMLLESMQFQGLQQGMMCRDLPDGTQIICDSKFGMNHVFITTPVPRVEKKKKSKDVYCIQLELPWYAAWSAHRGPITAEEMFFRVYFTMDQDGKCEALSEAKAREYAYLEDVWTETYWREWEWHNGITYNPEPTLCQPLHNVARGRQSLGPNGQVVIKLSGDLHVSLATHDIGATVWTNSDSSFLALFNHYMKWRYNSGTGTTELWGWFMPIIRLGVSSNINWGLNGLPI
jgi:hypothetical protein